MSMFCYQCEQTSKGTGCTRFSVCGKDEESAILQDLLVHATKGIAQYAHRARALGESEPAADHFTIEALFSTVTNVNFDPQRLEALLRQAANARDLAKGRYEAACRNAGQAPEAIRGPGTWTPAVDRPGLVKQGELVSILSRRDKLGPDLTGLQELLTYGLKGTAAYAITPGYWAMSPTPPTPFSTKRLTT